MADHGSPQFPARSNQVNASNQSKRLKATLRKTATRVVEILQDAHYIAYFAGGCVRDQLMGIEPKDYDIATDATPDDVQRLFNRTKSVGEHFGVILVQFLGHRIEVATFRAEADYSDHRRPDAIHFTDARQDALRRDFTINGMFSDPIASQIIDYVGGQEDLKKQVIRAIGDPEDRLAEDHLRALRAVRFSARFDFSIDSTTVDAIRRHARELVGVSRERIGHELRAMFIEPSASRAIGWIHDLRLDSPVLDEPSREDFEMRALKRLETPAPFTTVLAAWAMDRNEGDHDVVGGGNDLVSRWRRALILTNDECDALRGTLEGFNFICDEWGRRTVAARKRAASSAQFDESLRLIHAVHPDLGVMILDDVATLARTPSGLAPEPFVTGDDLVAAGVKPGPRYRQLLDHIYDEQLEDRISSREAALSGLRAILSTKKPDRSP